jgi:hypothetical protein
VRRRLLSTPPPPEDDAISFELARALRERDGTALETITAASFSLALRSPEGDVLVEGPQARTALLAIAAALFDRSHVGEWWGSSGLGDGAWWTSAPGQPFFAVLLSAVGGDVSRVDLALGVSVRDGAITRIVAISAGPLAGRPLRELGMDALTGA